MNIVSPGGKVVVVGAGPIAFCAAKLAAIKGFDTTALMYPQEIAQAPGLIYDDRTKEGSISLKFLPIAGPDTSEEFVQAIAAEAEGVILCVDAEKTFGGPVLESLLLPDSALKRVSMMSRFLNGDGMGPFASAAKFAANAEIWAGDAKAVAKYREMEEEVASRARAAGAESTVVRAGTLKGGATGSSLSPNGGGGEPTLLTPEFYKLGAQDVANWRLVYDCDNLNVQLVAGDTLPGPGTWAATTATDRLGPGDSHRGAVAACLVEALRSPEAAGRDFSVGALEGREFPSDDEWASMFKAAVGA